MKNNRKYDPKPRRSECVRAKCFECCAQFDDGRHDCEIRDCPLYPKMPYRKSTPKIGWLLQGRWSSKHRNRAHDEGLSLLEYVTTHYVRNGKLYFSFVDMMRAKCFRCCNDYNQEGNEPGRIDCEVVGCPLYRYTPYRKLRPDYNWLFDSLHTTKHRERLVLMGITREEYVEQFFGITADDENEEENEEEHDAGSEEETEEEEDNDTTY